MEEIQNNIMSSCSLKDDGDDDSLFAQPSPREDCAVCFLPLPHITGHCYQSCCGKILCGGCIEAVAERSKKMGKKTQKEWALCPFCREPSFSTAEEGHQRLNKRVEMNDATAMSLLGGNYIEGKGTKRYVKRGVKLWTRAAELGEITSCASLGDEYNPELGSNTGLKKDLDKALHYYEIAAKGGHEQARFNLGALQCIAGNVDVGVKHYMIAALQGNDLALEKVKWGYMHGHITKDDFAKALRAHQHAQDEVKSEQRTKLKQKMEKMGL